MQFMQVVNAPKCKHRLWRPRVHRGFMATWTRNGINEQVIGFVQQLLAERSASACKNVLTTGHSLGGAVASLAAFAIAKRCRGIPHGRVGCYTFGCPRVGNHAFAKAYAEAVPNTWHVINQQDAVVHSMKLWGWCDPPANLAAPAALSAHASLLCTCRTHPCRAAEPACLLQLCCEWLHCPCTTHGALSCPCPTPRSPRACRYKRNGSRVILLGHGNMIVRPLPLELSLFQNPFRRSLGHHMLGSYHAALHQILEAQLSQGQRHRGGLAGLLQLMEEQPIVRAALSGRAGSLQDAAQRSGSSESNGAAATENVSVRKLRTDL